VKLSGVISHPNIYVVPKLMKDFGQLQPAKLNPYSFPELAEEAIRLTVGELFPS
jgi:hypothetical protein